MAYKNDNTDWIGKEKRELFCKSVNSFIIKGDIAETTPPRNTEDVLKLAKLIVDTAFKHYPDNTNGKGEKLENIIN